MAPQDAPFAGSFQPLGCCPICGYAMDGGRCSECGGVVSPRELLPPGTSIAWVRFGAWVRSGCLALGILSIPVVIAFIVPTYHPADTPARCRMAEAVVGRNGDVASALKRFQCDVGRLPTTAEGLPALYTAPAELAKSWNGPYLEGNYDELRDPWGEELNYVSPGAVHVNGYDLWSTGPNRKADPGASGGDDIMNR